MKEESVIRGMLEATTLIVSIMTAMVMVSWVWAKMVKMLWLNSKRLECVPREQGVQANPYKFWVGDGSEIQSALAEWTGQETVPDVFIGGNHIGGCAPLVAARAPAEVNNATTALHDQGKLVPLLTSAGALAATNGAQPPMWFPPINTFGTVS
ncbi:hypothetical protein K1719_032770 [Acacia pycnantha]|nr:hypothetical protein K1719_032770 [Acacia pycnantha]